MKSWLCFLSLIDYEWTILKKEYFKKVFDLTIAVFTNILVFAYLFPKFNTLSNYGVFIFIGLIPLFIFFDSVNKVVTFVYDLQGPRTYSYKLILPLSSTYVFLSTIVSWAVISVVTMIVLYPIGAIFLWGKFNILELLNFKFILFFLLINFFFGCFSLWLVSLIKSISRVSLIWFRIINPLFMIGAYFYTWHIAYKTSKILGIIHLINPLVYIEEGIRAAVLGQTGFINFWICFGMIVFFSIFCMAHSIHRLKKRLDCV